MTTTQQYAMNLAYRVDSILSVVDFVRVKASLVIEATPKPTGNGWTTTTWSAKIIDVTTGDTLHGETGGHATPGEAITALANELGFVVED